MLLLKLDWQGCHWFGSHSPRRFAHLNLTLQRKSFQLRGIYRFGGFVRQYMVFAHIKRSLLPFLSFNIGQFYIILSA